jgi:hypothetical protein
MFSLIIGYCIDSGVYSAIIMIIINVIIDNSNYFTKLQYNIDKTYRIVNYTRIKPRSRPPQKKKFRIFYAPRFFSGQTRKKSAQIMRVNTVYTVINTQLATCFASSEPSPGQYLIYGHGAFSECVR